MVMMMVVGNVGGGLDAVWLGIVGVGWKKLVV